METLATSKTLTIHVGCQFEYSAQNDVPAICIVRPSGFDGVRLLSETWMSTPPVPYHDYVDIFGNVCRRLTLPAGLATIYYDARVEAPWEAEATDPSKRSIGHTEITDGQQCAKSGDNREGMRVV